VEGNESVLPKVTPFKRNRGGGNGVRKNRERFGTGLETEDSGEKMSKRRKFPVRSKPGLRRRNAARWEP